MQKEYKVSQEQREAIAKKAGELTVTRCEFADFVLFKEMQLEILESKHEALRQGVMSARLALSNKVAELKLSMLDGEPPLDSYVYDFASHSLILKEE